MVVLLLLQQATMASHTLMSKCVKRVIKWHKEMYFSVYMYVCISPLSDRYFLFRCSFSFVEIAHHIYESLSLRLFLEKKCQLYSQSSETAGTRGLFHLKLIFFTSEREQVRERRKIGNKRCVILKISRVVVVTRIWRFEPHGHGQQQKFVCDILK
jgi:hypothetical protein